MRSKPNERTQRQRLVSLGAIGLGLAGMLAAMRLADTAPPLPLMSLVVAACAWFGGLRHGYLAFALLTVAALAFDPAEIPGAGLADFVVFAVLSLGLIHGAVFAYRARRAEDRAHGALREGQQSMRATIDGIPAFIAYVDRDLRYVMHNRMYEDWFPGLELDGSEVRAVVGEAAFAELRPLLLRALAGEAVNGVLIMQRDGVRHQFDAHYRPHRGGNGEVLGIAVMIHDVTKRQHSNDVMRASEARLRSLAMASAAIVWISDHAGMLTDAQGWQEYTGQDPTDYLGQGWLAAVHAEDRQRLDRDWREACAIGEPMSATYRLRTSGGRYRMVLGQGIPIRDDVGRITEWIGTVRDIDDQYRLERDLRERERERDALLENVPHMVWIADADGDIVFSNRRWYDYTGLRPQDHWKRATHPDDIERAENLWRRSLSSGEPLVVEKRFRRASDGEYRWHLVQGVPIRNADGRIDRWYGSSVDIEDQKRAITMLADANQRISHFLSVLSHELRNPISGIVSASELLAHRIDDLQARTRALDMMTRQSRQLQRTIDDLLDISRVTEGRIELRVACCDIVRIVRDLVIDLEPEATRAGVFLEVAESIEGRTPWVDADDIRLRQIFTNLITNAIKASEPGHRVRIDIVSPSSPGRCRIMVTDEGIGLSSDIRDTLFEPYVQADGWRRQGRGLGLAIARQLAELHGGTLGTVEPDNGIGARFVLELPLDERHASVTSRTSSEKQLPTLAVPTDLRNTRRDAAHLPASDSPDAASSDRGLPDAGIPDIDLPDPDPHRPGLPARSLRILIVEDELDNAHALQTLLEVHGHSVAVVNDAEMAMATWRSTPHDIVLCDIALPGPLDGHDVARALRIQTPRPYLIAYTGYGQPRDLARSREAGFDEHIVKPATLRQILSALQRAGSVQR